MVAMVSSCRSMFRLILIFEPSGPDMSGRETRGRPGVHHGPVRVFGSAERLRAAGMVDEDVALKAVDAT